MGIFEKAKLWWKSTTTTEKILVIFGGVSTAAAVTGAVCAVKTYTEMEDKLSVEVKLYPNGKDDPNPKTLISNDEDRPLTMTSETDGFSCAPPARPMIKADTDSEKWEVWNPDWELLYHSESGDESVRLADSLDVLLRQDDGLLSEEDVQEAEARVEDLARQFAYLEGTEDDFRKRFPFLKDHVTDIYENVETKGE